MYSEKQLQENFIDYLKNRGYKEYTAKGAESTVYDYFKRVEKVCYEENIIWNELTEQINKFVVDYDSGGKKSSLGEKSHRAVINALKRYQEFVMQLK